MLLTHKLCPGAPQSSEHLLQERGKGRDQDVEWLFCFLVWAFVRSEDEAQQQGFTDVSFFYQVTGQLTASYGAVLGPFDSQNASSIPGLVRVGVLAARWLKDWFRLFGKQNRDRPLFASCDAWGDECHTCPNQPAPRFPQP